MAALFAQWTNTAYRIVLVFLVLGFAGFLVGLMVYVRTPYNTEQYLAVDQPVEFDHRHHVRDDGIDCLYCHGRVDLMARVYKVAPLSMSWCLDCHRDPARQLARGPRVLGRGSMWGATVEAMELDIPAGRQITRITTCSACHR